MKINKIITILLLFVLTLLLVIATPVKDYFFGSYEHDSKEGKSESSNYIQSCGNVEEENKGICNFPVS